MIVMACCTGLAESGIYATNEIPEIVADKADGRRYIVESDELLSAFLELEATLGSAQSQEDPIVLDHRYNVIRSNPEYARNR
jgi:hypothetical protein